MRVDKAFILTEKETTLINDIVWELMENTIDTPMEIGKFFLEIYYTNGAEDNKFSFNNKCTVFLNEEE